MKFFIVALAGLFVSMAADFFTYTWKADSDECECDFDDPNVDDINSCIVAADEVDCQYKIVAFYTSKENPNLEFDSVFANAKQQVFRLPDQFIPKLQFQNSTTPILSRATVELHIQSDFSYNYAKHRGCNVTLGTYASEDDPKKAIPVENLLEKAAPDILGLPRLFASFITKGANYIVITSNDDNCNLTDGIGPLSFLQDPQLDFTFRIPSIRPHISSSSDESNVSLMVAVVFAAAGAAVAFI